MANKKKPRPTEKPRPIDPDREATWKQMMQADGNGMTLQIQRDADVTLRDGLGRGLSPEAMEFLNWQITAWIGSRVVRAYERNGIMAQAVRIDLDVRLDTDLLSPEPG